jgi:hypothetical protein
VVFAADVSADDQSIAEQATRIVTGDLVVDSADGPVLASGDVAPDRGDGKRQRGHDHPSKALLHLILPSDRFD